MKVTFFRILAGLLMVVIGITVAHAAETVKVIS